MPLPLPHPVPTGLRPSPAPSAAAPAAAAPAAAAPAEAARASALVHLGWDEAWSRTLARHLDDHPTAPAVVGRVTRADRGACDVLVSPPQPARIADDAPDLHRVHGARWAPELARAAAADPERAPAAGDWVLLRGDGAEASDGVTGGPTTPDLPATWTVAWVLDRRTAVRRAEAEPGSSRAQVLAANADVVAVVEPMPGVPGRVERLLALAWASGSRPVVVLTKADLQADPEEVVARVAAVAPGVDVLPVAALDGHGLDPLRAWLAEGSTIALVGASGVGKSTLLNALVARRGSGAPGVAPAAGSGPDEPHEVMRTQPVRSDGKGRHTTVTRELHLAPGGGAVLDTPGVRTVGLAGTEELEDVFPEVAELARRCRFTDCAHRSEPGCAVQAAVADGDLPERRLASYRRLEREAAARAARVDVRLRAEMRREFTIRQREYRRRPDKRR